MPWQLRCQMKRGFSESDRGVVESLVQATPGVDRMGWQLSNPPALVVLISSEQASNAIVEALARLPFASESHSHVYEPALPSPEGKDVEWPMPGEVIPPALPAIGEYVGLDAEQIRELEAHARGEPPNQTNQ